MRFILVVLVSIFSTAAFAGQHLVVGLQLGAGALVPATGMYKVAGKGREFTREGLEPGTEVIREAAGRAAALNFGVYTVWYLLPFFGPELRFRYIANVGGHATHYFRDTNNAIIREEFADFDYYTGMADVGARVCFSFLCARPYVGLVTSNVQKFNFGTGEKSHISVDEPGAPHVYGIQLMLSRFGGGSSKDHDGDLDFGVDGARYPSGHGGFTYVAVAFLNIGTRWGAK